MKIKINNKTNVLVYGAGEAGKQLVASLEKNFEFKVVGFLDDNSRKENKILLGQRIYNSSHIKKLSLTKNVNLVFFMPSINRSKRNQIIKKLSKYKITVKTLPSIAEIIDGRVTVSDIKDLNIDDLLNRKQVKPNINLLKKNINKKVVLVTGAGGSIGSELCRQIIKLKPLKLLLLELNEFALYSIYEELISYDKKTKNNSITYRFPRSKKIEIIFETFGKYSLSCSCI